MLPSPPPHDPALAAAALQGALLMAGLIVAIGAQNLLVLRQGASGRPVVPLIALCTVSDWLLTALGVFGLGALVGANPGWLEVMRWGGVAFLAVYGAMAARRAWLGGLVLADDGGSVAMRAALLSAMAATWLNPHVYLDTVVLVGAVGAQHEGAARLRFLLGACAASLVWFSLLGLGARSLAPWLRSERTWRAIDASVALAMWLLALQLARQPLSVH